VKPRKYTVTRSLRFTPEEWTSINGKLGGRKWSPTARALLLGDVTAIPPPTAPARRPMSARDARLTLILAGVGNNLNQLAHATNRAALSGQRIDVLTRLLAIQREMERLQ